MTFEIEKITALPASKVQLGKMVEHAVSLVKDGYIDDEGERRYANPLYLLTLLAPYEEFIEAVMKQLRPECVSWAAKYDKRDAFLNGVKFSLRKGNPAEYDFSGVEKLEELESEISTLQKYIGQRINDFISNDKAIAETKDRVMTLEKEVEKIKDLAIRDTADADGVHYGKAILVKEATQTVAFTIPQ